MFLKNVINVLIIRVIKETNRKRKEILIEYIVCRKISRFFCSEYSKYT